MAAVYPPPEGRLRQATIEHTALGIAWLWYARSCRVIAREVGFSGHRLEVAKPGRSRIDLVGANCPVRRLEVLEVKGTVEDLTREGPMDRGKWVDLGVHHVCWLLVPHDATEGMYRALPPHWGVVSASEGMDRVVTRRVAAGAMNRITDSGEWPRALEALAHHSISGALPAFARVHAEAPTDRLIEAAAQLIQRPTSLLEGW